MTNKPYSLAVKAIMHDEDGRCLLIRRSAVNRRFAGRWEWPGGKVDPGEDFAHAVVREAKEETGLDVEITGLAGATHFEMPAVHVVMLCMEVRVLGGTLQLSDEHDAAEWVKPGEYDRLPLTENVRPFMLDYAARRSASS